MEHHGQQTRYVQHPLGPAQPRTTSAEPAICSLARPARFGFERAPEEKRACLPCPLARHRTI
jgi:hypothetical protein